MERGTGCPERGANMTVITTGNLPKLLQGKAMPKKKKKKTEGGKKGGKRVRRTVRRV
jgi:hypothetical protein